MRLRRPAFAVATTIAATGASVAQAQQPPTISPSRTPHDNTYETRYAGWVIWSEEIGGAYRLLARHAGTTELLPAPAGPVSQDPGVGPGPTGRPTVAYQRCVGAACQIWLYDLVGHTQRRVANVGTPRRATRAPSDETTTAVDVHPRIWGKTIAFQSSAGRAARVRIAVAGRGAPRTLRVRGLAGGASRLVLGPAHVAGLWPDDSCPTETCTEIELLRLRDGHQTQLDYAGDGMSCDVTLEALAFDGTAFTWVRDATAVESSGGDVCPVRRTTYRYDPVTHRRTATKHPRT